MSFGWHRLGNVLIPSGKVRVGDLGHVQEGPLGMVRNISVNQSQVTVYVQKEHVPKFGMRIMGVAVLPSSITLSVAQKTFAAKLSGKVAIDVGMLGIVDSKLSKTKKRPDYFFDKLGDVGHQLSKLDAEGAYLRSGIGDGIYPVFVFANKQGFYIDFHPQKR